MRIDELAEQVAAAMPALDAEQQRTALALYRLLASGKPVLREQLAERADVSVDEAARLLDRQPGVFLDDRGRVVGFWGMALAETAHRMRIDGEEVYAWCAWDTLFLPARVGKTITVESRCSATGRTIHAVVDPAGVREGSPHENTFTLSIAEGFEIGRQVNRATFGAILDGERGGVR